MVCMTLFCVDFPVGRSMGIECHYLKLLGILLESERERA